MQFTEEHINWMITTSPHTGLPKRQTARLKKEGEYAELDDDGNIIAVRTEKNYPVYQVGSTLPVQPGRNAKKVADVEVTRITDWENVRGFGLHEFRPEGYETALQWILTWADINDPTGAKFVREIMGRVEEGVAPASNLAQPRLLVSSRPNKYWGPVWVIEFRLAEVYDKKLLPKTPVILGDTPFAEAYVVMTTEDGNVIIYEGDREGAPVDIPQPEPEVITDIEDAPPAQEPALSDQDQPADFATMMLRSAHRLNG